MPSSSLASFFERTCMCSVSLRRPVCVTVSWLCSRISKHQRTLPGALPRRTPFSAVQDLEVVSCRAWEACQRLLCQPHRWLLHQLVVDLQRWVTEAHDHLEPCPRLQALQTAASSWLAHAASRAADQGSAASGACESLWCQLESASQGQQLPESPWEQDSTRTFSWSAYDGQEP